MFRRNKVVFLVALTFSVILLVPPVSSVTPPVASFTYTPSQPILGDTVIFNASDSYDPDGGSIQSYRWDFDDGTPPQTLLGPTTTHDYTAARDYNVTLTVTDEEAETDTTWQIVTVRDYPVASFTYSPENPIAGETMTFDASSSTPNGGNIANYTWDFDDGNITTVTGAVITHVYADEGSYNVTLTVADDEGLNDTCFQLISLRGYPVASFTHSPTRPIVDETATFDASLSTPKGGTITSYYWDFDDSNNGTGKIVNHNYTAVGNYNVTLTITDSENLTDTAWDIVTVRDYPVANFTYSPAAPLVNEIVTFNASLSTPDNGTIVSYEWDFGDSSLPVIEADPITNHTYTGFGTYNITLTITDSEDLTDTVMDTIRILINPVANFTYSPTWPVVNETVTFNASASYDPDDSSSIVSYRWDFADTNITTVDYAVITHAYTAEGTYNVTLIVTDDDGLTDTTWKLITIYTFLDVHDVAITNVTTSATEVYVGQTVNITVVVKNEGTAVETFNVTVYYGASIGTQTVTILLPGAERTLTFSWNTTGLTLGNYTISAQASILPGPPPETDTADNTFTDGTVEVKGVGDVNGDGTVDIYDLVYVALRYGSEKGEPPPPGAQPYDAIADINGDGIIDLFDVVIIGIRYGDTYP